jgi:hypothetical protein
MNPIRFSDDVSVLLSDIIDNSGAVLYSAWETVRPGEMYIMGLNPGGDPEIIRDSIRGELNSIKTGMRSCNAYLEPWRPNSRTPLQVHMINLIECINRNIEEICASNLVFLRSRNQSGVSFNLADLCWPVHQYIIRIIQPKYLLVFGNGALSPYSFLRKKHFQFYNYMPKEDVIDSGHGVWKCRAFQTTIEDSKMTVVGLPHLSRYRADDKPRVIDWLMTKMPL